MSVIRCKMCGASLNVTQGMSVTVCEYCGTQQTLPKLDSDRRANLYDRASHYRRNNEFDKAIGIYEQILNEDNTDAEAYWSLILCKYGIVYVEDPGSKTRIPTVNRIQYTSVFDDDDYKSAIKYADPLQRDVYCKEAQAINTIQKKYLEISQKEAPFDVFICYKESDAEGKRTPDSVLAQDLYYGLTNEGLKVFFARITLEDKLGSAYEPYIFSALNSAKVMVVLGTKPEYFNATWVKNEWSRYLALIKNGAEKVLIPAYRDMDPYDMPEEFSHLQAQNMANLGFMQDLLRGIRKITGVGNAAGYDSSAGFADPSTVTLLKRARIFLEEKSFIEAEEYCEKVLDIQPENGEAYLCKLMAQVGASSEEQLINSSKPLKDIPTYRTALRFVDPATATRLQAYNAAIEQRISQQRSFIPTQTKIDKDSIKQGFTELKRTAVNFLDGNDNAAQMNFNEVTKKELKKKKRASWALGVLFLFIFWPVGVFFFIRYFHFAKELKKYK